MSYALPLALLLSLAIATPQTASSHAPPQGKSPAAAAAQATAFGNRGKARDVTHVIDLDLRDTMRIVPDRLTFKQGETVRLRIRNSGALPHEFVLGTQAEIIEHRDMMRTMPTMKHEDANAVSVAPGRKAEVIWRFSKPGSFLYACLVPGHWEAGMQGVVTVSAASKP